MIVDKRKRRRRNGWNGGRGGIGKVAVNLAWRLVCPFTCEYQVEEMPVALDRWPRGGPHLHRCNIQKSPQVSQEETLHSSSVSRVSRAEEKGKVPLPSRRRNIFLFLHLIVAAATAAAAAAEEAAAAAKKKKKKKKKKSKPAATSTSQFSSTRKMFRWKVRRRIRRRGGGGGGTCYLYLFPGAYFFCSKFLRVCQLFFKYETNRMVNVDVGSTGADITAEKLLISC